MRGKRALLGLAAAAAIALTLLPQGGGTALAHPLGNFTINRYSGLELDGRQVTVHYVVDMAEIPAFSEFDLADRDGDGEATSAEKDAYFAGAAERYREGLELTAGSEVLALKTVSGIVSFPPGQAGLRTLRVDAVYQAALPVGATAVDLRYEDGNFAGRPGWQEIVVVAREGASLLTSDAPSVSVSNELRKYPEDSLALSPAQSSTAVSFKADPSAVTTSSVALEELKSAPRQLAGAGFARLITAERLSAGVVIVSLLAAMGFGALHAIGPGHGKTVVAAYLVGSRGTARHAVFLGATVTLTHTISVYILGGVTLWASQYIVPERLYPWLTLASGLTVVALGALLFISRLRRTAVPHWLQTKLGIEHDHHEHDAGHSHELRPERARVGATYPAAGTAALALAGPTSLSVAAPAADARHHHDDPAGAGPATELAHIRSHLPPGADGSRITWRSLLALGVSGGLLPCPTALVVLLGAISLQRAGFGMLLIVAFSLGLAGVLTGIGLALVWSRRLAARFDGQGGRRRLPLADRPWARAAVTLVIPVGSALAVAVVGLVRTAGALSDPLLGV